MEDGPLLSVRSDILDSTMERWIREVLRGLRTVSSLRELGRKRSVRGIKTRIRRNVEHIQAGIAGAAAFTLDGLIHDGIIKEEEREYAADALDELMKDGYLEYKFGFYFLKGRGPKGLG